MVILMIEYIGHFQRAYFKQHIQTFCDSGKFSNDTSKYNFPVLFARVLKSLNVNNCYLEIWGFARLYKHLGVH